jgi:L-gulono-1,4-lactone dehydrogenase
VSAQLETGTRWRNWGRSQDVTPLHVARPETVDEVIAVVNTARLRGLTVKAIGASHSFTGIAATRGVQVDVSRLDGVYAVEGTRVTLGAGTNLYQLPALLDPLGLALTNMGDIDRQTIAGATSTGTHGTGAAFGGLATQVVALTLVTAAGELLRVSETENAELLPAARLGLGALGIVVEITIECVPSFALRAVEKPEPLADVLDDWMARSGGVDHFEFYWFPHTETALTKSNHRLPADTPAVRQSAVSAWVDDELLSNGVFAMTCGLGTMMPRVIPGINNIADKLVAERDITDVSHRIFVAPRRVRFREMEYAIPRENVPEALRAVQTLVADKGWKISFPVEVRVAAADDNWLSTAYGRESGYIAVHRYYREDPTEYFEAVESIMKGFGGRPHWGKMNYRDAESLATVYPRFDEFRAVRDRLDPERLFTNEYLDRILGA